MFSGSAVLCILGIDVMLSALRHLTLRCVSADSICFLQPTQGHPLLEVGRGDCSGPRLFCRRQRTQCRHQQ